MNQAGKGRLTSGAKARMFGGPAKAVPYPTQNYL